MSGMQDAEAHVTQSLKVIRGHVCSSWIKSLALRGSHVCSFYERYYKYVTRANPVNSQRGSWDSCQLDMDTISRAKCEIWKVSAREEKLEHRKCSKQAGSQGCTPPFSVGHFQYKKKENAVRLKGRHIFSFFIPL